MGSLGKSYDSQNRFWKVDFYYEISQKKRTNKMRVSDKNSMEMVNQHQG